MMPVPRHILPAVVFAQFAGTSVWFATNAVIPELEQSLGSEGLTSWLTSAVQIGFITGSLLLAATGLADRFQGRTVFLVAALLAAASNSAVLFGPDVFSVLMARFICGFALAGVYPVGMKVVSGWFEDGLGNALGWLVGALVLGTASPHLVRSLSIGPALEVVVFSTTALAVLGGITVFALVPPGPHAAPPSRPRLGALPQLFRDPVYRKAAFGYFGHMWELYTFWAFLPVWFATYVDASPGGIGLGSFAAIAMGAVGCVAGGRWAARIGSLDVARAALLGSACFALGAPAVFAYGGAVLSTVWMLAWGAAAVADSPQLSTLTARGAPASLRGTGLALATALGFGLTVVSLLAADVLSPVWVPWMLLPGPLFGLWALAGSHRRRAAPETA